MGLFDEAKAWGRKVAQKIQEVAEAGLEKARPERRHEAPSVAPPEAPVEVPAEAEAEVPAEAVAEAPADVLESGEVAEEAPEAPAGAAGGEVAEEAPEAPAGAAGAEVAEAAPAEAP
jgi:hypothetical protein